MRRIIVAAALLSTLFTSSCKSRLPVTLPIQGSVQSISAMSPFGYID